MISQFPLVKTFKERLGIGNTLRAKYLTDAAASAPYHLSCTCLNLTTDRNMALCTKNLRARVPLDLAPITPDPISGFCQAPFVLGTIEYISKEKKIEATGCLLVIQSAATEQMSLLLCRHKRKFPDFPQETTADQFFCEDQFKAYRQLGREIADIMFRALPSLAKAQFDSRPLLEEYEKRQRGFSKSPDHSSDSSMR